MTSPSSVRWIGHFAAITRSWSTCSSLEVSGQAQDELEFRWTAPFGRVVLNGDLHRADVPALALGIHLDRDRRAGGEACREQLLGVGALVLATAGARLIDDQLVVADGDGVREVRRAAGGGSHGADRASVVCLSDRGPSLMVLGPDHNLGQGIHHQSGEHLREEVGRLRRHVDAGRGDLADLLHRRRSQQERGVVIARGRSARAPAAASRA